MRNAVCELHLPNKEFGSVTPIVVSIRVSSLDLERCRVQGEGCRFEPLDPCDTQVCGAASATRLDQPKCENGAEPPEKANDKREICIRSVHL